MFAQAVGMHKLSRAHLTRMHHFFDNFLFDFHTMHLGVTFESVGACKFHTTRFTLERFCARMHKRVSFQMTQLRKGFVALRASKRFFACVHAFMRYK
jgi:hypothetical protein